MICFYHKADFDGKCSGFIITEKYPEVDLIPINYGDYYDLDTIPYGETVIIVDFSFPPEDMYKLANHCKLIWIDHHISAINESKDSKHKFDDLCEGIRKDGIAACRLCWDYFFPEKDLPKFVDLLARYDVWDIQSDPDILPFQFGMRLKETNILLRDNIFHNLMSDYENKVYFELDSIINQGQTILEYEKMKNREICSSSVFNVEIDGHLFLALNTAFGNSISFDSVKEQEHDGFLLFSRKQNNWTASFYTDKDDMDMSKIAKKFGGGGHKQAAGCVIPIGKLDSLLGIK